MRRIIWIVFSLQDDSKKPTAEGEGTIILIGCDAQNNLDRFLTAG